MPLSQINSASIENASVAIADLSATGTPSSTTFLRGDNVWAAPASGITSGTAVSASGTSVDFTGIPSTAKRITVMFDGVSTNGASNMQIQLGTSSGVQTTGYNCIYSYNGPSNSGGAVTTGFPIFHNTAADTKQGHAIFVLLNNNVWAGNGNFANLNGQPGYSMLTAGSKSLGGTLDRVRITTINGTDTFDAGTINILYE